MIRKFNVSFVISIDMDAAARGMGSDMPSREEWPEELREAIADVLQANCADEVEFEDVTVSDFLLTKETN